MKPAPHAKDFINRKAETNLVTFPTFRGLRCGKFSTNRSQQHNNNKNRKRGYLLIVLIRLNIIAFTSAMPNKLCGVSPSPLWFPVFSLGLPVEKCFSLENHIRILLLLKRKRFSRQSRGGPKTTLSFHYCAVYYRFGVVINNIRVKWTYLTTR